MCERNKPNIMNKKDFIHYLKKDGTLKLNAEGDDWERPWEIEPAKRLFDAFKEIGNILNSTSHMDATVAARAMSMAVGHPTLEQNFMRMMFGMMEHLATQVEEPENEARQICKFTDHRNRSGRVMCHTLLKMFQEEKGDGAKPSQWLGYV